MAGKKGLKSITEVCGGQDEKYAGLPCEYFNVKDFECEILRTGNVPDMREIERCQSIVMYYADILSDEQWKKDGAVTDHEDLRFDVLFKGLHGTSLRGLNEQRGQRYEMASWHGYIKKAVRNAILKKINKTTPVVRGNDSEPEESDEDRLQKMVVAQSSFAQKKDRLEDDLNAKINLSALVDALTEKIRDPATSEKETFLCLRRRTLIINLLHLIRNDKPANEACVELRRQRTQDKAERERFRREMKYDREALMDFFLQKKTMNG